MHTLIDCKLWCSTFSLTQISCPTSQHSRWFFAQLGMQSSNTNSDVKVSDAVGFTFVTFLTSWHPRKAARHTVGPRHSTCSDDAALFVNRHQPVHESVRSNNTHYDIPYHDQQVRRQVTMFEFWQVVILSFYIQCCHYHMIFVFDLKRKKKYNLGTCDCWNFVLYLRPIGGSLHLMVSIQRRPQMLHEPRNTFRVYIFIIKT